MTTLAKFDKNAVNRGTKCFSRFHGSKCQGAFPKNFLKWVKENGWWGEARVHLCAGLVEDPGSLRIDIRPETKPDLVADATNTGLASNKWDWVFCDPPYSKDLAQKLYGTEKHFKSINAFAKEAARITKSGGLVLTLSYEVPATIQDCDLIAIWGIYTCPAPSMMRCFSVWKKR